MATPRKPSVTSRTRRSPATTPEALENRMISLAVDLAEQQMLEGTASSQVITHYLKLGTTRERLEQEKISREVALLEAKQESMASAKRVEELYGNALDAMRAYSGQTVPEEDFDD